MWLSHYCFSSQCNYTARTVGSAYENPVAAIYFFQVSNAASLSHDGEGGWTYTIKHNKRILWLQKVVKNVFDSSNLNITLQKDVCQIDSILKKSTGVRYKYLLHASSICLFRLSRNILPQTTSKNYKKNFNEIAVRTILTRVADVYQKIVSIFILQTRMKRHKIMPTSLAIDMSGKCNSKNRKRSSRHGNSTDMPLFSWEQFQWKQIWTKLTAFCLSCADLFIYLMLQISSNKALAKKCPRYMTFFMHGVAHFSCLF